MRRYEPAYRKVHACMGVSFYKTTTHPKEEEKNDGLFEKMEGRLRWLSRRVARYMCIGLRADDFEWRHDEEENSMEEDTPRGSSGELQTSGKQGEDREILPPETNEDSSRLEPTWKNYLHALRADMDPPLKDDHLLVLCCCWEGCRLSNSVRSAFLDLLATAQDYQIMIVCDLLEEGWVLLARSVTEPWGIFANRAPGCSFDKDDLKRTKHFVDIRDLDAIFGFVVSVKKHGGLKASEEEKKVEYLVNNMELREQMAAKCLKPFETLWTEEVNGVKSSRYGRMPKLGVVFEILQMSQFTPNLQCDWGALTNIMVRYYVIRENAQLVRTLARSCYV